MSHYLKVLLTSLLAIASQTICPAKADEQLVSITNKGRYYEVFLTVPNSADAYFKMGRAYGNALKQVPNYEENLDSYLKFVVNQLGTPEQSYRALRNRARQLKGTIPKKYHDELRGIASTFEGSDNPNSMPGDKQISEEEFLVLNMLTDVARPTQCSVVACFGSVSDDGTTHIGRNLDWYAGDTGQILNIHAVIHYRENGKEYITVGFLGCQGMVTGINQNGVFVATLDSPTWAPYTTRGKRSYWLDLRQTLERAIDAKETAEKIRSYGSTATFNHSIFVADSREAMVVENNFSGYSGGRFTPKIRYYDSKLHDNVSWEFRDAVGSVNTFLLKEHFDNHHIVNIPNVETDVVSLRDEGGNPHNGKRWQRLNDQLHLVLGSSGKASSSDIQKVITSFSGSVPRKAEDGDLFNDRTIQCVVFDPATKRLRAYFRKLGDTAAGPFEDIPTF